MDNGSDAIRRMSIRSNFAATAPEEPLWDFSVMIGPRPDPQWKPEDKEHYYPPLNERELDAYDNEYKKQQYSQWPWVWADAVLAAQEKVS